MESLTNFTNCEQITRSIVNLTNNNSDQIDTDIILQIIDKIEGLTGCKLYNKDYILSKLNEIPSENLFDESKNMIIKNLIPQVDFNTLFKSNLNFIFVFNEDDITILYNNKCVTDNNLSEIKFNLIHDNLIDLPPINELYIDNLLDVLNKFINKDLSVKYYCINIPEPYWKLFEIKCKKINSNAPNVYEKCQELEEIISGKYYKQDNIQIINQNQDDNELKAVLMQIEEYENKNKNKNKNDIILTDQDIKALDDIYRMEVMSYLNDDDIMLFLNTLETLDTFDKSPQYQDTPYINNYIKTLLESISAISNKIAKFYYVYRLYKFINLVPEFINNYDKLRNTVATKINEFNDDLYIIQTAGLKLYDALILTVSKTKEMITNIEKNKNPNNPFEWTDNNQQYILNDINNKNIINQNNNFNQNNNYNQIELVDLDDDDDEDEDEYND